MVHRNKIARGDWGGSVGDWGRGKGAGSLFIAASVSSFPLSESLEQALVESASLASEVQRSFYYVWHANSNLFIFLDLILPELILRFAISTILGNLMYNSLGV